MTPALPSSSEFLLPQSLNDLHHTTLEWESNIELWKRELIFFQKLIKEYGEHLHRREEVRECDHFKMLLDYYAGQLMTSLTNKMINHEVRLKALMRNTKRQDESEYRKEHRELDRLMSAYEKEFQCYKHELFQLIEKVMVRNKLNGQDDHMEEQLQIIDLHNVPPSS
jgi:hypothetical protein